MLSLFNQVGPVPTLAQNPVDFSILMSLYADIKIFEEEFGRSALQNAIYNGAFSFTVNGDITLQMCHPPELFRKVFPDYIRNMYINSYT